MGIPATNDMFKEHSWYFRDALVRASYKGLNISSTTEFAERFLRNLPLTRIQLLKMSTKLEYEVLSKKKMCIFTTVKAIA